MNTKHYVKVWKSPEKYRDRSFQGRGRKSAAVILHTPQKKGKLTQLAEKSARVLADVPGIIRNAAFSSISPTAIEIFP